MAIIQWKLFWCCVEFVSQLICVRPNHQDMRQFKTNIPSTRYVNNKTCQPTDKDNRVFYSAIVCFLI